MNNTLQTVGDLVRTKLGFEGRVTIEASSLPGSLATRIKVIAGDKSATINMPLTMGNDAEKISDLIVANMREKE